MNPSLLWTLCCHRVLTTTLYWFLNNKLSKLIVLKIINDKKNYILMFTWKKSNTLSTMVKYCNVGLHLKKKRPHLFTTHHPSLSRLLLFLFNWLSCDGRKGRTQTDSQTDSLVHTKCGSSRSQSCSLDWCWQSIKLYLWISSQRVQGGYPPGIDRKTCTGHWNNLKLTNVIIIIKIK